MQLHIFGPFFGLALTWILYRKGSEPQFEKEKSAYKTGLISMLGTATLVKITNTPNCFSKEPEQENHVPLPGSAFIWMFWPSFNSILVDERSPERDLEVVCSTYLALAASAVAAAAVAVLLNPKGKLSLVRHPS